MPERNSESNMVRDAKQMARRLDNVPCFDNSDSGDRASERLVYEANDELKSLSQKYGKDQFAKFVTLVNKYDKNHQGLDIDPLFDKNGKVHGFEIGVLRRY